MFTHLEAKDVPARTEGITTKFLDKMALQEAGVNSIHESMSTASDVSDVVTIRSCNDVSAMAEETMLLWNVEYEAKADLITWLSF